ncbi:hypothetical protein PHLCEN_2v1120 [Hermanssonia centrifuga]|uniref:Uncharacterized protein n=1 Tax=Hermanssonia centrifuga TaxID=98765 RepID=A0A2R6S473_9APHY|nr:hypothetical protein PHLCEN_2v1120 [Hermanssonia centrifuga]
MSKLHPSSGSLSYNTVSRKRYDPPGTKVGELLTVSVARLGMKLASDALRDEMADT